jgi:hypothetical protein
MTKVLSGHGCNLGIDVHETRHHRGAGFYDPRVGMQGCIGAVAQDNATTLELVPLIVAVHGCEKFSSPCFGM